ncbi:MAG: DUF58 domain-containing protein [Actinomycetota bacterium]|nr:DUF58 domain-containing protein [Actinomycetota bacterium]
MTVALIAGLLFIAGSTAQASWLFVIAAGVLGLVFGSLFMRHHLKNAEVVRTVPRRGRVGDDMRVGLRASNGGARPLPLFRLSDSFGAFDHSAVLVERLKPGEEAHVELVKSARRRGVFSAAAVTLTTGAPFGFLRSTRTIDVASDLVVVPRWVELKSFPILEPSSYPADVLHERARTGAGEEFIGVREYRPGDPPRAVHWRSTARAGRLVVREFEEEVASRVSLVLAGADVGVPPDSAYETLVSAVASIGIYALQTGHPVELLRAGPRGEIVRIADPDRFSLLEWLAQAQPIDAPLGPLVAASIGRSRRRGTVVLFSPSSGIAAASVPEAVRSAQSAGCRAIVIGARSSTWADHGDRTMLKDTSFDQLPGGRAAVRMLSRDDDLARCIGS